MTLHSEALHHRAAAAREKAKLAAEKLRQALLDHVVSDCPPSACQPCINVATSLEGFSLCWNVVRMSAYEKYMAGINGAVRDADMEFRAAYDAARDLTNAAQALEYRPTL